MNIHIITQDDPFYLPIFFDRALSNIKQNVVGVTVLNESKSKIKTLKKFYSFYGPWLFCVTLFWYFVHKISDAASLIIPVKNVHSVRLVCRKYGIASVPTENINSSEFINQLKRNGVDLIVSVASPQIFKKELIQLPALGCINVHGAPLPKYRGMMPSFWMMLNNEPHGAVTAHYMDEELDSGDIILQKTYDIDLGITHHDLVIKSKKIAADLLIEALNSIECGSVVRKPNNKDDATYFSFPGKKDLLQFAQAGKKLR